MAINRALASRLAKKISLARELTRKEFDTFLDGIDAEYYNKGTKPITDTLYDDLMEIYAERFPRSARLKKVGAKIGSKRAEVPLPYPMSSLDKIKTEDKIAAFDKKFPGDKVLSDKEDGMSLELGYLNGKAVELYTRGDGLKGQDISHLLPFLKIPKKISIKEPFYIRTEAVASNTTFSKHLDKKAGGDFTAVRNAAGGITGKLPTSKDFDKYKRYAKHLTLFAFKILAGKGSKLKPSAQFALLKKLGFDVVPHKVVKKLSFSMLSKYLGERITASDYDLDGIVVEHDTYHKIGHAKPKHAVSFKENSTASMVDVRVTGVTWNVSRTGKIIPQVNIEPTRIGGVTVTNFTGHNAFYILHGFLKDKEEHKSGAPARPIGKGAIIRAVRSGQVIPYIVEVIKPAKKASVPSIPYVKKGVHFVAEDKGTNSKQKQKALAHFLTSIGVDGFKLSSIVKFWDAGYTTLRSYLELTVEDFESIDGLGKQKAREYLTSLRKALDTLTFAKLADGSGYFNGFGNTRLESIAEAYPDIMSWDLTKPEIVRRIQELPGFKQLANDFAKGLPKLQRFASKYGFRIKRIKTVVTGSKMKDVRATFTGVRDKALEEIIKSNGGVVQSMRKDTNVVIVKDESFSSSKVDKAVDQGIPVLTLDRFRKKYKV